MSASRVALYVTAWLPTETNWTRTAGIAKRQYLLLDGLKQLGGPIHVLLLLSPKQFDGSEPRRLIIEAELREFWKQGDLTFTICAWRLPPAADSGWKRYVSPALNWLAQREFRKFAQAHILQAFRDCVTMQTDVILCQGLRCIVPALMSNARLPPLFLDMDDVEHVSFRRRVKEPPVWPSKYLDYLQIPALIFAEWRAISLAAKTFVCSELDRLKLARLFRTPKVMALPNAVALGPKSVPAKEQTLLMLGHYSFVPNRVGAEYFLENVWPLVRKVLPDAQLVIAGAGPEAIQQFHASPPGVLFTGYVNDINTVYAETRAVVCPILSGGGTRLKVMEAAAHGRPIASTRIGAEGIDLKDGSEILLADSPVDFANACIKLLTDYSLAVEMGHRALQRIEYLYGRENTVKRLAETMRSRNSRSVSEH